MRTRIAAMLAIGVSVAGLLLVLRHTGASSAFAAVQERLREVRTVSFQVTTRGGEKNVETVHVKLLGEDLGRAEHVSDGAFTVFDRKQRKMMNVKPDERKAIILTNVKGTNPIPNLFDLLLGAPDRSVEELGDREIDGKTLTGFVAEFKGQKVNVWVNGATNLPARIEEQRGANETIFGSFVYNTALDPAEFQITPPKGYKVEHRELLSVEDHARRAIEQEREALKRAREAAEKKARKSP